MANGGSVSKNESAKSESRPMPSEMDNDSAEVSRNSAKKPMVNAQATDNPTVKQAQKPSLTRLTRPRMVGSDAFSVRDRDEVEADLHRTSSEAPASPEEQPPRRDDELEADKSGPKVSDMQKQHNNMKPAYAMGGDVEAQDTEVKPDKGFGKIIIIDKEKKPMMAEGGMVTDENQEERHASIAAAIMAKRAAAAKLNSDSDEDEMVLMAEGGMVDISANGKEEPNAYYPRNKEILKENYDSGLENAEQPMDSNEHGDMREDEESDPHDMISSIMKKRKAK